MPGDKFRLGDVGCLGLGLLSFLQGEQWTGLEGPEEFLLMLCLLDGGSRAGSFPGDRMQYRQERTELWDPNFPPAYGSMRSREGE